MMENVTQNAIQIEKILNKGEPNRRCLVCKHWKPETECTGKCSLGSPPIYKYPNYVCSRFEHF